MKRPSHADARIEHDGRGYNKSAIRPSRPFFISTEWVIISITIMVNETKKLAKKSVDKAEHWYGATVKTEVPQIVLSDEFHINVDESSANRTENTRRMMIWIGLAIGLAIIGVVFLWLTHEEPI
jgi:hypothetical protein